MRTANLTRMGDLTKLAAVAGLILTAGVANAAASTPHQPHQLTGTQAQTACQAAVRTHLAHPDSAQWGTYQVHRDHGDLVLAGKALATSVQGRTLPFMYRCQVQPSGAAVATIVDGVN